MTTFASLSPADRVAAVEQTHKAIRRAKREKPLEAISSASEVWLQRMKLALVDPEVSRASVDEMVAPFIAYLKSLGDDEQFAVLRAWKGFLEIAETMPADAASPADFYDLVIVPRRRELGLK